MTYTNAGQLSEIATLLDSDEPVWPDRVVVTCDTCGALLMTSATTLHDAIHATIVEPIENVTNTSPSTSDATVVATIGAKK